MPIDTPHRRINAKNTAQSANFAKSLPIEISNSPLTVGRNYMATLESDEEVIYFIYYIHTCVLEYMCVYILFDFIFRNLITMWT